MTIELKREEMDVSFLAAAAAAARHIDTRNSTATDVVAERTAGMMTQANKHDSQNKNLFFNQIFE